ncbi:DUF3093 domain-containing protein [Microbacterium sp. NPDC055910]|uniref:DUF3093 domain-containing protein n=1 Tax=Microbacterium sp. NPDC055910 TaxID=3345659 RepID=UPI0035E0CCAE
MASTHGGAASAPVYRERLSPSLWLLVAAALCGPMAALIFSPVDTTLALAIGIAVAVLLVALLVVASPVIEVRDGMLRAGRARIEIGFTGEPVAYAGEAARHARGSGLDPRAWHVIRGGIDGVVVVPILDIDDPAPNWVISTRTPDRLRAALRRDTAKASAS